MAYQPRFPFARCDQLWLRISRRALCARPRRALDGAEVGWQACRADLWKWPRGNAEESIGSNTIPPMPARTRASSIGPAAEGVDASILAVYNQHINGEASSSSSLKPPANVAAAEDPLHDLIGRRPITNYRRRQRNPSSLASRPGRHPSKTRPRLASTLHSTGA